MIGIIYAKSTDDVFGATTPDGRGYMPWPRFKNDLARFKGLTSGSTVLMGRGTYESLPRRESLEGPLPGRRSLVVTSRSGVRSPAQQVTDPLQVLTDYVTRDDWLWVIGGPDLISLAYPFATRIEQTVICKDVLEDVPEDYRVVAAPPESALFETVSTYLMQDSATGIYLRFNTLGLVVGGGSYAESGTL